MTRADTTLTLMPHPSGPVADQFAQRIADLERSALSPRAVRSYETGGRQFPDTDDCSLRTPFQRDRDRIVHCKAFRRLKQKTQVFIAPEGDHFRTRLTHTLEVSGIARGVARALRLNEDLTEAVALGHDLGHAPFGHTGEEAIDGVLRREHGRRFRHNEHSLRVVDVLEHDGRGLNLTEEVRDGILHHTGAVEPSTLEGGIVRLVDRFAYVNHDIDDALRAGILDEGELPVEPVALLGDTASERIDALVHDLVETSDQAGAIRQSPAAAESLLTLRSFMFENVYVGPIARRETVRAREMVEQLLLHFLAEADSLPGAPGSDAATRATDWVAGMTDRYCIRAYDELLAPR
ncbi:MAG: dGTPase [Gaiellales bacterium]|nr:dGTPase [Gaiellales bacterium]